jgi:hypothetical protein
MASSIGLVCFYHLRLAASVVLDDLFELLQLFLGVWGAIGRLFNWDDPPPDERWTDDPEAPPAEPYYTPKAIAERRAAHTAEPPVSADSTLQP